MDKTYKHIAFLVVPNATLLDITGPYEAFSLATQCLQSYANKDKTKNAHSSPAPCWKTK